MRAQGFGERVVLGTDIYEIFTTAPRGRLESACSKPPFYEVAGNIKFTAESARITGRGCQKQKEFWKQDQCGIVAQIFCCVEKFGWNFSASDYSEPDCMALSSSAMVTAAEKVQRESARMRGCAHRLERSVLPLTEFVVDFLSTLCGWLQRHRQR
jgi:hypothetical protein